MAMQMVNVYAEFAINGAAMPVIVGNAFVQQHRSVFP